MSLRQLATGAGGFVLGLCLLLGFLAVNGAAIAANDEASFQAGPPARTPPARAREHVIEGTKADDVLDGGEGDDWLFGYEGSDVLRGAGGNDTLDGASGDDTLVGGAGRDVLDGGAGRDGLVGGDDNDWLDGGDDEDTIDGGAGNDDMAGGDAADTLNGGAGDDTLAGGDGSDVLTGGDGADRVLGGDDDDRLSGGPGDDALDGGDGRDAITGDNGKDRLDGGEGDDNLRGGIGDDTLEGDSANDVLLGEGDNDTLLGSRGDDTLDGGDGHDTLIGGDGLDIVSGGAGDDFLLGGLGTDTIRGGPEDDVIVIRAGDVGADEVEFIDGGSGNDSLVLIGFNRGDLRELPAGSAAAGERSLIDPLTGGSYRVLGVERIQHAHLFTQFGTTEKLTASFTFVNPSSNTSSSGRLLFFDSEGAPLRQSIAGGASQPAHDFVVPALGRVSFEASGPAQKARGTAFLLADLVLSGTLQTSLPDFGALAAGAATLVDSFIVPVAQERATNTDTGVAIFGSTTASSVKLTLRRTTGEEVSTNTQGGAEIEIPANGHRVVFVRDLFPWVDGDFQGAMTVEGGIDRPQDGGPLAGTGLQREGKTGAVSTFPVISVGPPPPRGTLHFASVPAGGGTRSSITLVNPSPVNRARGTLSFFDPAGLPRSLPLNGLTANATFSYEIPPLGSAVFATLASAPVSMGSARVTMAEGVVGGTLHVTSTTGGILHSRSSDAAARLVTQVRRVRANGVDTQVALSATGSDLTLRLVLRDQGGVEVPGGQSELKLTANGSIVQPLAVLFPKADTDDFRGTLVMSADGGPVAATVVEAGGAGVLKVMPIAWAQD